MVRFDENTGYFFSTDLGRIASHFYIKYDTVEVSVVVFVIYLNWFKIAKTIQCKTQTKGMFVRSMNVYLSIPSLPECRKKRKSVLEITKMYYFKI